MLRLKIGLGISLAAAGLLVAGPALAATGWTVVPAPPTGQNAFLTGISADGASDAWAVGSENAETNGVGAKPVLDHWNGSAWSQVTAPPTAGNTASLAAVSASSATDAWAVGRTQVNRSDIAGMTMHWNGTAWTTVPAVSYGVENILVGVTDISPADAYAVGDSSASAQGFLEQWNGTSWSLPTLPDPNNGQDTYLNAVSASSASNVWAVGHDDPSGSTTPQTLTLNWNGSAWSTVASPDSGSSSLLSSVSASPGAAAIWAAGYSGTSGSFNPLILQNG